ncbi:MAG: NAD(P)-dependent dehydrogenase (short-subunit alcohol dehydrogenase family) [Myxococcota bacterium]|jgi:NAD(P)-dependent dehydrogenase (short-subunit alcohol dehydrogenase family)
MRVLVFGATGGIGAQLTRELTQAGAHVFGVARRQDELEALSNETGMVAHVGDVLDADQVKEAFSAATSSLGGIDSVVLAVGSILLRPVHLVKDADFDQTIAINLGAAFRVVRTACKLMMRADGGSIILFSTAAAQIGLPNHEVIAAAKAGIEGLVRSAAATYAGRGVRVNCVAPGLVRTPLAEPITRNPSSLEASRGMHALGRIGEPDDVTHAVRFLLESTWTTGQTLVVDGGLSGIKSA